MLENKIGIIHEPVLLDRVVSSLITDKSGVYVDATLGTGGHAEGILRELDQDGVLIGIDLDEESVLKSRKRLSDDTRFLAEVASYTELRRIIFRYGFRRVNGVLFDLGLSSFELSLPHRGFSFQQDGNLDMRYSSKFRKNAYIVVNKYKKEQLIRILKEYGEIKRSKAIASAIVESRMKEPIRTTQQLRQIIEKVAAPALQPRLLAQVFQALRIEVNDELQHLKEVLNLLTDVLTPGGRAVFISYHSLEDRIIKEYFNIESRNCICPPEFPVCQCNHQATFRIITDRPITPDSEEVERNPRSRSAKMRVFERL